jgi:hypothetical protein
MTAWWITTGEAGFRTQARGLAEAVAPGAEEKTIGLPAPWSLMSPWPLILKGLDAGKDVLTPPWPEMVVSCGRKAGKVALAVKRASGGRTLAVHVQNPLSNLGEFDLVMPMRHDPVTAAPNVMPIDLALHDVTPQLLAVSADAWREPFALLPRPLTGVLLGGVTKRHPFTLDQGRALAAQLKALRAEGTGRGQGGDPRGLRKRSRRFSVGRGPRQSLSRHPGAQRPSCGDRRQRVDGLRGRCVKPSGGGVRDRRRPAPPEVHTQPGGARHRQPGGR